MSNANVLVLGALADTWLERIERAFGAIAITNPEQQIPQSVREKIKAIILRSPFYLTAQDIQSFPKLHIVIRAGSGRDQLSADALKSRGILFKTCEGNANAVAELVFTLILSFKRRIIELNQSMARDEWRKFDFIGSELAGKRLVIVGFGRIGRRIAEIAVGFLMSVVAVERDTNLEEKWAAAKSRAVFLTTDLNAVLPDADIVVLACPLTSETHGLIGEIAISRMKQSALIVNVARGAVWDIDAVIAALNNGHLAGACCDVYACEPLKDWTICRHPKMLTTPHIGAQTVEAHDRIGEDVWRSLTNLLGTELDAVDSSSIKNWRTK